MVQLQVKANIDSCLILVIVISAMIIGFKAECKFRIIGCRGGAAHVPGGPGALFLEKSVGFFLMLKG